MSEKKEKTAAEVKKEKKNDAPAKKKENVFKKAGGSIKKFFKDFKGECKKVTWPSGKTVVNNSLVVIVVVLIVGLAIFGIDQGLAAIIGLLKEFASDREAAKAAAESATTAVTQMISMFLA